MTDGPRCAHSESDDVVPMFTIVRTGAKVIACRVCGHLLPEKGAEVVD